MEKRRCPIITIITITTIIKMEKRTNVSSTIARKAIKII